MTKFLSFEIGKDFIYYCRTFNTSNDFYRSTTFITGLDINIAYMDVGKGCELGAEALNTLFNRCAQDIAI